MSQTIDVNMTPGLLMPTIYYSQGDIGREFKINISSSDGTAIPAGATVKMQATKPSGLGFSVSGTLSNGVATFTTTETMTNEAGRVPAELVLEANGDRIGTANFYWQGEKDPHPQGTVDGDLDDVMPKYMTVTVTSLAPNTTPTYTYDPSTNTANFGIPRGADGSLSSGVLASTYSSSSKYAVGDYVYYSGSLYRCITAITTAEAWTSGHWTQVALANEVNDLTYEKNALGDSSLIYSQHTIVDYTSNSWRLLNNGLCESNANYKMLKYYVYPGQTLKIVSDDKAQFQTVSSVPSTGASNRIDKTYGIGTFILTVPTNASWLIISTPVNGSTAALYNCSTPNDTAEVNDKQSTTVITSNDQTTANGYLCLFKGRLYKYTNNTSGSVNFKVYDRNGTTETITNNLASGKSIIFEANDNYIRYSSYMAKAGSCVLESVDESVFKLANLGANANVGVSDLYNAVDAVGAFHNIANPSDFIDGSVWVSATSAYSSAGWHRTELAVEPNHDYTLGGFNASFCWMLDDDNTSLGQITTASFTTPNTCTKIRISGQNTVDLVCLTANVTGTINSTLYPYGKWFSLTDPDDIKNLIQKAIPIYDYTTISMFPSVAVVGDSFESGGIYIDADVGPYGMFYDYSWPTVMGRNCGSDINNYSKAGLSTRTWLTDADRGLTKALADDPSDFYMLCLGINDYGIAGYLGTISDITNDYTQNPDTFYGNYARIFEQLEAHSPTAKFVFVVPPLITSEYAAAIEEIANHYNVPSFRSNSDDFFKTDFYTNNKGTSHPVAMTYAGMALAYERLVSYCIQNNTNYFFDVH